MTVEQGGGLRVDFRTGQQSPTARFPLHDAERVNESREDAEQERWNGYYIKSATFRCHTGYSIGTRAGHRRSLRSVRCPAVECPRYLIGRRLRYSMMAVRS